MSKPKFIKINFQKGFGQRFSFKEENFKRSGTGFSKFPLKILFFD